MGVEVSSKLSERFGHVFAAEAEANVARLVVDGSRQEQDCCIFHNVFTKRKNIALPLVADKTDRAGVGLDPFEEIRTLAEEGIQKGQVAQDEFAISLDQDFAMA